MPEHTVGICSVNAGDLLLISSDILTHIALDLPLHDGFGFLKTISQFHLVSLGFESGEEGRFIDTQREHIPRGKSREFFLCHGARRSYKQVTEFPGYIARSRIPRCSLHLAGLCDS